MSSRKRNTRFHSITAALCTISLFTAVPAQAAALDSFPILQSTSNEQLRADYYVPSTVENISWGHLPNRDSKSIMTVTSGSTVTFDTISHEGILEDQGRDPEKYFASFGIRPDQVLDDAKAVAASELQHDFDNDGPHVVTGPIEIQGAEPEDVLKVEVLSLTPGFPTASYPTGIIRGPFPANIPRMTGVKKEQAQQIPSYTKIFPNSRR